MATIVDVVLSPDLINDSEISVAQMAALKALYGLPFATGEEVELYSRATEKTEYKPSEKREAAFICGRRAGKDSKLAANICIYEAFFREHRLSPGERGYVLLLAANTAQARITFGYIRAKLESSPLLSAKIVRVGDDEIDLDNGITIAVVPANFRTIRGRSVVCCICSEIAFWFDKETNANPAREILKALRPSMATFPNAKLILISSPWAKSGVLWEMYEKRNSWFGNRLVWRSDSLTMNPSLDRERLKEEEQADPENYAREYLAEFWDSASSFLPPEAVDRCVVKDRGELAPQGQRRYTFSLDAAFRVDEFAFAGVHREGDVVAQDVNRSWRGSRANPVNLAAVLDEIVTTLKWYRVGVIYGDQFCSEPIRQALAARGIRFEQRQTLGSRAGCFNTLRTLVMSGKLLLIDDASMVAELKNLQVIRTTGGNERVEAQGGGRDDRSVALALAAHECVQVSTRTEPQITVMRFPIGGGRSDSRGDLYDPTNDCGFTRSPRGPSFGGG